MSPNMPIDPAALPPGTRLVRRYMGEEHVVTVCDGATVTDAAVARRWWRYLYRGRLYRTLTAISKEITGQRNWSGPSFFGLTPRARDRYRAWFYDPTSFLYIGRPKRRA